MMDALCWPAATAIEKSPPSLHPQMDGLCGSPQGPASPVQVMTQYGLAWRDLSPGALNHSRYLPSGARTMRGLKQPTPPHMASHVLPLSPFQLARITERALNSSFGRDHRPVRLAASETP